jgi:Tfp pilus assembly protein PilO
MQPNAQKKNAGKQILLTVAIVALVIGVAVVGMFMPQQRKLKKIEAETALTQAELAENEIKAQTVPALIEQVERMKLLYKDFNRRLPAQDELGGFLETMSAHLLESQLVDELIQRKNPIPGELFYTLPVVMHLSGDYLDVAEFLQRLDGMERLARVETMKFHRNPNEAALDIELQINIYFTAS